VLTAEREGEFRAWAQGPFTGYIGQLEARKALDGILAEIDHLRAERDLLRAECAASRKLDATDLSQRGTGLLGERLLVARAAVDAFVMSRAAPPSTAATPSTKEAP
jgi:hypothetical protein